MAINKNEDQDSVFNIEMSNLQDQLSSVLKNMEHLLEKMESRNVVSSVKKFITIRNELSKARKSYEDFETFCKNRQEGINQYLVAKSLEEGGIQNFNTPYGTAYLKNKIRYQVNDWDEYAEWLVKNDMLHCVEKRPAKTAVEEYFASIEASNAELSPDELESKYKNPVPPGLERVVELEFGFRKA